MSDPEYIAAQAAGWIQIGEFHREYDRNPPNMRPETADGPGATLALTEGLIVWLSDLIERRQICTMLDMACGDWSWMRMVDLGTTEYTGWDVDPGRIETCRHRVAHADFAGCGGAGRPNTVFEVVNALTVDQIVGGYDLVLAREFLTHITNEHVLGILDKLRGGGDDDFVQGSNEFLLASTFPGADNTAREWHPERATWEGYLEAPIDLSAEPFNLGEPLESFKELPGPHGILTIPRELALFSLA